ncbi:PA4642 family protein [Marinicellulosiphila megalodicopiae]|uniref:PA4642 family protein n=1 Tax=Marinicellulosiphila megalodicopiae TaxID=2724896 RepID=UPI003BAEA1B9
MKKDKVRVEEEVFSQSQIESYLECKTYDEADAQFVMLEKAYRSMPLEHFEKFLDVFLAKGYNLNAKNVDGQTISELMIPNKAFQDYLNAIQSRVA